jgi:hypothetical protein
MKRLLLAALLLLPTLADAQIKVNALPASSAVGSGDLTIDDQAGTTKRATFAQVATFVGANLPANSVTLGNQATLSAYSLIGNATASTATPTALTTPIVAGYQTFNASGPVDKRKSQFYVDASGNTNIVPVNDAGVLSTTSSFTLLRGSTANNYLGFSYTDPFENFQLNNSDLHMVGAANSGPAIEVADIGTAAANEFFLLTNGPSHFSSPVFSAFFGCSAPTNTGNQQLSNGFVNSGSTGFCSIATGVPPFGFSGNGPLEFGTNGTQAFIIDASQNVTFDATVSASSVVIGVPGITTQIASGATTDTTGFLYIDTVAGVPTGVPNATAPFNVAKAMRYDTTDDRLYVYNGAWKDVADHPTAPVLTGTTGSIGGGLLAAGTCASGTAAVTGATTAMAVAASPVTYPGDGSTWLAYVSAGGTVTVKVCALVAVTPGASAYNVRVLQ